MSCGNSAFKRQKQDVFENQKQFILIPMTFSWNMANTKQVSSKYDKIINRNHMNLDVNVKKCPFQISIS